MRALIHRFASLRVTVVLVVLVLLALSSGTIVESLHGAPAAGRLVYGASWFRALLAVFALNLVCSLIDLWPWGRRRVGYAITHGSMLLILAGALTTDLAKTDGQLQIWEGESASAVTAPPGPAGGEPVTVAKLPFAVQLDAFEIDYYEGTRMPAQFRSRVTVKDGTRETKAVIEMNHELAYGGWRFFQSSYRRGPWTGHDGALGREGPGREGRLLRLLHPRRRHAGGDGDPHRRPQARRADSRRPPPGPCSPSQRSRARPPLSQRLRCPQPTRSKPCGGCRCSTTGA